MDGSHDNRVNTNPFPGLRPFREDEEYLFFGRESQVDTMVDKLAATRFLAVVGVSGSGKSSLVNCGLRPALHSGLMASAGTAWRIAKCRPGGNPIQELAKALAEDGLLFDEPANAALSMTQIVETNLRMSKMGLIDVYQQAKLDDGINLLVIVDQFEELFRYRHIDDEVDARDGTLNEDQAAFVNLLLEPMLRRSNRIHVVLTMRSDFLGDCTQFPGLAEAINEGQYLVPRMTRHELRAAITGPIHVGGADIEPTLLTRLVNDVGDNPDQLSILQHALNRTWASWENEGGGQDKLSLMHYDAIGTMSQALDQHAEKAYAELATDAQKQVCETLFRALTDMATDSRGVRRPTKLGLLAKLAEVTEADVISVIEVFRKPSRSFLMPPAGEDLHTDSVIDISHESLMRVWKRLTDWASKEAQSVQMYRRLAETAALHAKGQAALWRDPELELVLKWKDQEQPSEQWANRYRGGFAEALAFLESSVAQRANEKRDKDKQKKERRRFKTMVAILMGLVFAGVVTTFMAYFVSSQETRVQEQIASIETAAASALADALRGDPVRGIAGALQHVSLDRDDQIELTIPNLEKALWNSYARFHSVRVIADHDGEARSVVINGDGTRLATGAYDSIVNVYDTSDWSRIMTIDEDGIDRVGDRTSRILGLAYSPDGTQLATASWSHHDDPDGVKRVGRLKIWDANTGAMLREFKVSDDQPYAQDGPARQVNFDHEGKRIVSTSYDNTARVWDVESGRLLATLVGHRVGEYGVDVYDAAFAPTDPDILVTGGNDGRLIVWDLTVTPNEMDAETETEADTLTDDGTSAVTLDESHALRVIDAHQASIQALEFHPHGNLILTSSTDDTVRIWDWRTGQRVARPLPVHIGDVWRSVFDAEGSRFVTVSWDRTLAVWDFETFELIVRLRGHTLPLRDVVFNPVTGEMASVGADGTLRIWSITPRDQTRRIDTGDDLLAVAVNPADPMVVASGGKGGTVHIRNIQSGNLVQALRDPDMECRFWNWRSTCEIFEIAYSETGTHIATVHRNGGMNFWDVRTGQRTRDTVSLGGRIGLESIGGDRVAISYTRRGETRADDTLVVEFRDITTGEVVTLPQFDDADLIVESAVRALAYNPQTDRLVGGFADGTAIVWDLQTGERSEPFVVNPETRIVDLDMSDDGRILFASSADLTLRAWDLETDELKSVMVGHDSVVRDFTPLYGGHRVASVSNDETLRIWDTESGREIVSLPGQTQSIAAIAAVPGHDLVVSADAGGTLLVRRVFPDIWSLRDAVCDDLYDSNLSVSVAFEPDAADENVADRCPNIEAKKE